MRRVPASTVVSVALLLGAACLPALALDPRRPVTQYGGDVWHDGLPQGTVHAVVQTRDTGRAVRVSNQIDAGTVWVNDWFVRDLRVPFGGMKASGVGREGGQYSMEFYTEAKTVCLANQ